MGGVIGTTSLPEPPLAGSVIVAVPVAQVNSFWSMGGSGRHETWTNIWYTLTREVGRLETVVMFRVSPVIRLRVPLMFQTVDMIWSSGAGTTTWLPDRDWTCWTIVWLAKVPTLKDAAAMMAIAMVVFHLCLRLAGLGNWIIPSPNSWVLFSSRPSSALCRS